MPKLSFALFFSIISTCGHGFRLPASCFLRGFQLPAFGFLRGFQLPAFGFLPPLCVPLASLAVPSLSPPAAFGVGACVCGSIYLIYFPPCLRYFLTLYIYIGRFYSIYLELV